MGQLVELNGTGWHDVTPPKVSPSGTSEPALIWK